MTSHHAVVAASHTQAYQTTLPNNWKIELTAADTGVCACECATSGDDSDSNCIF